MEIETIKEDAKEVIAALLNKSIQVEYSFILNYPRLIDRITAIDQIHDEQLIKDLERVGKDSTRHLGLLGELIIQLGGKPMWQLEVIDRLVDAENMFARQLEKEKLALSLCQEAKRVAEGNKTKVTGKGFFGRLIRMKGELPFDVVNVSDVIGTLDRTIAEETYHIRLVEDSIATLTMLLNK